MLDQLQAERQMRAIEAAIVPHAAEETQSSILDRVFRALGHRPRRANATDLALMGIPVRFVPKQTTRHGADARALLDAVIEAARRARTDEGEVTTDG